MRPATADPGGNGIAGPGILDELACPACAARLARCGTVLRCACCHREYPVLFGIPDLRLAGDRYLSLEAERAKAGRLAALAAAGAGVTELVEHYYAITDDVPPSLARRFKAYIASAPARGRAVLDLLRPDPARDRLIDLGTGSGGLLVAAAGRCREAVGVDVALRWLVIAKRRLEEAGATATLICADIETPPFARPPFDHAVAMDLLEHVRNLDAALAGIASCLRPGGNLWLSAINRHFLGPHPAVGLWAAGWLPQGLRARLLRRRHGGVDTLREALLIAPSDVAAAGRRHGLIPLLVRPRQPISGEESRSGLERHLLRVYCRLAGIEGLAPLLAQVGPAFEMVCERRQDRAGPRGLGCASA